MEKERKDTVLLTVIGIATLLVAVVGATFAYFTARLTNSDTSSTLTIRSGNGGASQVDGGDPITVENIYPRAEAWVTKPWKITYNTDGESGLRYKVQLNFTNTFNDNQIMYNFSRATGYCTDGTSLTSSDCTSNSGTWSTNIAANTASTGGSLPVCPNGSNSDISGYITGAVGTIDLCVGEIAAGSNQVHAYILTISYPDSGINQNYTEGDGTSENTETNTNSTNQGKALTAWINSVDLNNG